MTEKSSKLNDVLAKPSETQDFCEYTVNGVIARVDKNSDKKKMTMLLNKLKKIPTGQAVLDVLARDKVPVTLTAFQGGYGGFSTTSGTILLNSSYPLTKLCSSLVHETRHYMQHKNGAKDYERYDLDVRSQIMLDRAKEADAQVWAFKACREWLKDGDRQPYERFTDAYSELYRGYAPEMKKNKELSDKMLTSVFKSWYGQVGVTTSYEGLYFVKNAKDDVLEHLSGGNELYYDPSKERKSLSAKQVLEMVAGDYLIDGEKFITSKDALVIHNFTKQMLSHAFAHNGVEDASLEGIPVRASDKYKEQGMVEGPITEANFLRHSGLRETSTLMNIPKDAVKKLMEAPVEEQKAALDACGKPEAFEEFRKTKRVQREVDRLCRLQNISKAESHLNYTPRAEESAKLVVELKDQVRKDEIYLLVGSYMEKNQETKPELAERALKLPLIPEDVRKELKNDAEKLFKPSGKPTQPITKEDEKRFALLSKAVAARFGTKDVSQIAALSKKQQQRG